MSTFDDVSFRLEGRRLCFDLTATLEGRHRCETEERLVETTDLDRWLELVGLGQARPASREDLLLARQLREAIRRLADCARAHQPLDEHDVAVVNAHAARATHDVELDDRTGCLRRIEHDPGGIDRALAAIAVDAVYVLGSAVRDGIKECAAEDCALLFVDDSRSGRRRWCSMELCGNRAKVRAHRRRATSKETA